MTRFHHILSGIVLLALFFTIGIVSAADTDANLSISKVVNSAAPYVAGQPITWVITLSNNGPANATNISLAENFSGFSGQVDMSGVADLGTYDNDLKLWNISKLDNATSTRLTVVTIFSKSGKQTNNVDILGLDQTNRGNGHAEASIPVINNAAAIIPDQPLKVNLTIRPHTLNLKSKGIFTVFVTLNDGTSLFPSGITRKSRVDFSNSSLTCNGAEMISAGVSNKDGGTLIAKFHRQDLENVTGGAGVQINCSGSFFVNGKSIDVEGSDTIRVIGERKGLDKVISGLMKFLGLEKDDISVNETEDGNVTLSFTLNPDTFKNNGQMKNAIRTMDTSQKSVRTMDTNHSCTIQNVSDHSGGPQQDTLKNNGKEKNNYSEDKGIRESNALNKDGKVNKNTDNGNDASNGKSNGKKNK